MSTPTIHPTRDTLDAPPRPCPSRPSLARTALACFKIYTWRKRIGTALGMTLFFVLYFTVLRHPIFPVTTMPLTRVDHWIGFHPTALILYISLWIYVPLLPALLTDLRELIRYVTAAVALSGIGLAIFILWPTTIPPVHIDWTQHPSVAFLKNIDASGNACPSLHAAFAIFTLLGIARLLPRLGGGRLSQLLNFLWGAGIVYSTLATRQHVAIDALAGSLLGAIMAAAAFYPLPLVTTALLLKFSAVLLWFVGLPLPLAAAMFVSLDGFILYKLLAPNSPWLCPVLTRFQTDRPEVWLTIDDGPDPTDTPLILDLLDRHEAKATFFLIGERAARHPELVSDILRRGHGIGHHTHTHPLASFWCATPARLDRELDLATAALARPGVALRHFRAPAGINSFFLAPALAARNLTCVGWNVRSCDSLARNPRRVIARVMRHARPGSIILMHEGTQMHPRVRVTAITGLLAALDERGLRCVVPAPEQLR